jgi:hypothetical protein
MFGLSGRGKPHDGEQIRTDYVVPAPEQERAVAAIDAKLRTLSEIPRPYRAPTTWARMDALLDERNTIRPGRPRLRPSVPVVPGRTS